MQISILVWYAVQQVRGKFQPINATTGLQLMIILIGASHLWLMFHDQSITLSKRRWIIAARLQCAYNQHPQTFNIQSSKKASHMRSSHKKISHSHATFIKVINNLLGNYIHLNFGVWLCCWYSWTECDHKQSVNEHSTLSHWPLRQVCPAALFVSLLCSS